MFYSSKKKAPKVSPQEYFDNYNQILAQQQLKKTVSSLGIPHSKETDLNFCSDLIKSIVSSPTQSPQLFQLMKCEKYHHNPKESSVNPEKPIIYRYFDLHGFTGNSAKMALESILRNIDENRLFVIYVVVGKGTHSERINYPVLKGCAEEVCHDFGLPPPIRISNNEGIFIISNC
jgi:hypothetical protein